MPKKHRFFQLRNSRRLLYSLNRSCDLANWYPMDDDTVRCVLCAVSAVSSARQCQWWHRDLRAGWHNQSRSTGTYSTTGCHHVSFAARCPTAQQSPIMSGIQDGWFRVFLWFMQIQSHRRMSFCLQSCVIGSYLVPRGLFIGTDPKVGVAATGLRVNWRHFAWRSLWVAKREEGIDHNLQFTIIGC